MQEALTWTALIASAGSITAFVTFWFTLGGSVESAKAAAKAACDCAESAKAIAVSALTKVDLLSYQMAEYKVDATREFASADDLKEVERRLVGAVDNLGTRFDRMADRLDRFFELMERRGP